MAKLQRYNGTANVPLTDQNRADHWETFEDALQINASGSLTWPAAAGRYIWVRSAAAVALAVPTGTIPDAAVIKGMNRGAGALTFTGAVAANAILPATIDQNSAFLLRWDATGNTWVREA
jgi:hypothetical protein